MKRKPSDRRATDRNPRRHPSDRLPRQPAAGAGHKAEREPILKPIRPWNLLALASVLPLLALALLQRFHVPLGKPGTFTYLYSPLARERLVAVPEAVVIAAIAAFGVWLLHARSDWKRAAGVGAVIYGVIALAVWTFTAPPAYVNQVFFNMQSPSHDGAFLVEAQFAGESPGGLRGYLADFPQRAQTPKEQMRGTRVVSNPPGTTLLASLAIWLQENAPPVADAADGAVREVDASLPADLRRPIALTVLFGWLLTVLWALSPILLFLVGREFLGVPAAAAYALCVYAGPATMLFTPGKDPAQLLTVALGMWLWLRAARRGSRLAGLGGGVVLVLGAMLGVVHVWIGGILVAAELLVNRSDLAALRRAVTRGIVPVAAGALLAWGVFYLAADWNVLSSATASVAAQARVTRGADAMPWRWQSLGIPLFMLFAGTAAWALVFWWVGAPGRQNSGAQAGGLTGSDASPATTGGRALALEHAGYGRILLLLTGLVLIATVGFTNVETPRLWIPFTPLLLLGLMLQVRPSEARTRRAAALLAVLVAAQIAGAALQWHLMDMREAENRLVTGGQGPARFFE